MEYAACGPTLDWGYYILLLWDALAGIHKLYCCLYVTLQTYFCKFVLYLFYIYIL